MDKIKTIQVIVDPLANAQPCVDKAAVLAAKFNARVELFICDTHAARQSRAAGQLAKKTDCAEQMVPEPKALLDLLAELLSSQGIDVNTKVDYVNPLHEGLLKQVQSTAADLVVKDTHHHSFVKRAFITNTDWHLIRGCAAPLLLTKPTPWREYPTVLVAVDPGHVNDKPATLDQILLQWGALVTEQLRGAMHVAHAYVPTASLAASAGMPPIINAITPDMMQVEDAVRRKEINALLSEQQIDAKNIHVQLASASELLPRLVTELSADILVIGAISRSGLQRIFIGSTAEQILEHANCDLLIVKPLNFADGLPF